MEMARLCITIQDFMSFGEPLPSPLEKVITRGGNGSGKPYFFLAKGDDNIYISIRGACEPGDFGICLDFERENLANGKAHRGILNAARWVIEQCDKYINECRGKIICTGHSLGGAVSSMICSILRLERGLKNVYAVSMAPFPILSSNLVQETKKYIMSFVYNNDVVPHLNSRTIGMLVSMFCPPGPNQNAAMLTGMINQMLLGIMQQSGYMQAGSNQELAQKLPSLVQRLLQMSQPPEETELFMPGSCYHIQATPDGNVTFTIFNEATPFNVMAVMGGLMDHNITNYIDNIMGWDGPEE
uniref:Triacylglycerol lipase n=1 Tax=Trichomonas vaginalis TaxID=5722 RepID=Q5FZZ8_TRIVA|nr:triacylglycerol lipase [Trichomonas vaginalis]